MEDNTSIWRFDDLRAGELLEELFEVVAVDFGAAEDEALLGFDGIEDGFEDEGLAEFDVVGGTRFVAVVVI